MTFDEYQSYARRTANPEVVGEMALIEGVLGIDAVSGETANVLKRALFQGHDLNYTKIAEELGDLLWYISRTCDAIGITMGVVAYRNVEKLKNRFPEGFEAERSVNRVND